MLIVSATTAVFALTAVPCGGKPMSPMCAKKGNDPRGTHPGARGAGVSAQPPPPPPRLYNTKT